MVSRDEIRVGQRGLYWRRGADVEGRAARACFWEAYTCLWDGVAYWGRGEAGGACRYIAWLCEPLGRRGACLWGGVAHRGRRVSGGTCCIAWVDEP